MIKKALIIAVSALYDVFVAIGDIPYRLLGLGEVR